MAKETRKIAFTNAILDIESMTISEFDREDNEIVYDLLKILTDYHGVPGISMSISKCEDINGASPDEMEEKDDI